MSGSVLESLEWWMPDNVWVGAIVLGGIAAGMYSTANRRNMLGLRHWAALPLVLAIVVGLLPWVIPSGRQRIAAGTRALVTAAHDPADMAAFDKLIDNPAQLTVGNYNLPRGMLLELARSALAHTPITDTMITELAPRQDSPEVGHCRLVVLAKLRTEGFDGMAKTQWDLDWKRHDDGTWRLTQATLLKVNDEPARMNQIQR